MKSATRSVSPDLLRQMSGHADDARPHAPLPLLPVLDFVTLMVVGYVSLFLFETLFAPSGWQAPGGMDAQRMTLTTAALGAFALHDRQFGARRNEADGVAWAGRFAARFLVLVGVLGVIAFAGRWLGDLPSALLLPWLLAALAITFASRTLLRRPRRAASGRDGLAPAPPSSIERNGLIGDRFAVRVLADRPITRWSAALKTGVDRLACVILLLLLAPVMLLIVLAIKIDSPGPVLFRQRRHGFRSREFNIYKFRTMQVPAAVAEQGAALHQTERDDCRITRIGRLLRKYSLDELPQFFNVLEGTMSLVGPRPHAVDMRTESRLGEEIVDNYLHRHRVKPGITGWSQIHGARGATTTVAELRRRVELDLHYVEHWSPLLDLKILSRTFRAVLRATNAY